MRPAVIATTATTRCLRASEDLAAGRPVVLLDDSSHGARACIVLAAEAITTDAMARTIRHTSGLVTVTLSASRMDALGIPIMTAVVEPDSVCAFGVAVDASSGLTTGISARDRALTARRLADPRSGPSDLIRPGHVMTVATRPHGTLSARRDVYDGASDLCRLAGKGESAVVAEVVSDDGAVGADVGFAFARENALTVLWVDELAHYLHAAEGHVTLLHKFSVPDAACEVLVFAYDVDNSILTAVAVGDVCATASVPVYIYDQQQTADARGIERRAAHIKVHRVGNPGAAAAQPIDDQALRDVLRHLGIGSAQLLRSMSNPSCGGVDNVRQTGFDTGVDLLVG